MRLCNLRDLLIVTSYSIFVQTALGSAIAAEKTRGSTIVDRAYPIATTGSVQIRRYRNGRPITLWLPSKTDKPVPVVVFNHGRSFGKKYRKGSYRLAYWHPLVNDLNARGIAVAVPVRSGYHSTPGPDQERIPCNRPKGSDFNRAARAASRDVLAAVKYVRSLPMIDRKNIFVGGTSAGGFATIVSLSKLKGLVKKAFVFNGGRCGKRGKFTRGIQHVQALHVRAAKNSDIPVLFYASLNDTVVPPETTRRLSRAFCNARGERCKSSVFLLELPGVGHSLRKTAGQATKSLVNFLLELE